MALANTRSLKDLNLQSTTVLPADGATTYGNILNLATQSAYRAYGVEVLISVPALPNLTNGASVTFALQDSADGVTFANVASVAPLVATGAGGTGSPAVTSQFKLPLGLRQFIRVAATDAGGDTGNNTASSVTLSLVF